MKNEEYKKLSISEFTKAAGRYESNHAGIYEMCKKDYPDILAELEKEPFKNLLDAGCGPAPMISLFCFIGFSLLNCLEFFVFRKMKSSSTINHPLCGCESNVIQKKLPFRVQ